MQTLLIAAIILLVLIFLGLDIYASFLVSTVAYLLFTGGNMTSFTLTFFSTNNQYALLAVPLFLLGGTIMERSGIANSLVNWCEVILRKFKSGMGAVIPFASMIFGAMCGSFMATVSTIGSLMIDRMEAKGWDRRYTTALAAVSGPLGYMIPPNINACVFALASGAAVSDLFMATIIPGIIWGVGYCIVNKFYYKKWWHEPTPEEVAKYEAALAAKSGTDKEDGKNKGKLANFLNTFYEGMGFGKATLKAIPALIMPLIIIGGIYSGAFTPTEAGGVSAVYAVLAGILIFKKLTIKTTFLGFKDTAKSLATLMITFPAVMVLTRCALMAGLPQLICDFVNGLGSSAIIKLLIIDLVFIVAGCFVDAAVLVLVLPTLLAPTMTMLGVGSIQFGVIVFVAVGIGSMTPPMASCLFVGCKVGRVKLQDIIRPMMPFLLFVAVPVMLLVTYVPALSTWLPSLLR